MAWVAVKNEYVIETLAKGVEVIICDFKTCKMLKCSDLTIMQINTFINSTETVFYKGVANDQT